MSDGKGYLGYWSATEVFQVTARGNKEPAIEDGLSWPEDQLGRVLRRNPSEAQRKGKGRSTG